MPSALRPEPSASVLQRVMVRGLERRPIFRDDLDQADCLARLAAVVAATGLTVSTWAPRPIMRTSWAGLGCGPSPSWSGCSRRPSSRGPAGSTGGYLLPAGAGA